MVKMKRQKTIQTKLSCEVCGTILPIVRKASKKKEVGHTKHMYCPGCREITAFKEMLNVDKNISFWDEWHETI